MSKIDKVNSKLCLLLFTLTFHQLFLLRLPLKVRIDRRRLVVDVCLDSCYAPIESFILVLVILILADLANDRLSAMHGRQQATGTLKLSPSQLVFQILR